MDGNARWAARQGQPTSFGHEAGVRAFRGLVANCASRGIQALTVSARPAPISCHGGLLCVPV